MLQVLEQEAVSSLTAHLFQHLGGRSRLTSVQNQPSLDSTFQRSYFKTKDKQNYQIQQSSNKLDTRPLGQCVDLAQLTTHTVQNSLCSPIQTTKPAMPSK